MEIMLKDMLMKELDELEDSIAKGIDKDSPKTLAQLSVITKIRQAAKKSVFDMTQIPKDGAVIFRVPPLFLSIPEVEEALMNYMDYLHGLGVHGLSMVEDILTEVYADKQGVIDHLRQLADQLETVYPVGDDTEIEATSDVECKDKSDVAHISTLEALYVMDAIRGAIAVYKGMLMRDDIGYCSRDIIEQELSNSENAAKIMEVVLGE